MMDTELSLKKGDVFFGDDNSGLEIWLAENKCQKQLIGEDIIKKMLKQSETVMDQEGDEIKTIHLWLFAYSGITQGAEKLIKQHNILWSSKKDLNQLLEYVNLRRLPDLIL